MVQELQPWFALVVIPFVLGLCYVMACITQKVGGDGRLTYEYAGFHYEEHARFDNTWPTWSTDYIISFVLLVEGVYISGVNTVNKRLKKLIISLLFLYGGSTLIGGLAHQTYDGNVSMLNGIYFYVIWIAVVGCTAVAGGIQGLIGMTTAVNAN